jgi:hypothetical protein
MNIAVSLLVDRGTDRALWFMHLAHDMRANGDRISSTALDLSLMRTATFMKVILLQICATVAER